MSSHIMLIIHILYILLGMSLCFLPIDIVQAFRFDKFIDLGTSDSDEEFFCEGVRDGLPWYLSQYSDSS